MVKKILSVLGVVGILSTMMVSTAFAADDDTLIQGLSNVTFDADGGETSGIALNLKETAVFTDNGVITEYPNVDLSPFTVIEVCVNALCPVTIEWDGKDDQGVLVPDGTYHLTLSAESGPDTDVDTSTITVAKALGISNFTVTTSPWDPTQVENTFVYALTTAADVVLSVLDGDNKVVKSLSDTNNDGGSMLWAQVDDKDDLPLPGFYDLKLEAIKGAEKPVMTYLDALEVAYTNELSPAILNLEATPNTFEADEDETEVSFELDHSAYVEVNILDEDGDSVFVPDNLDGDEEYDDGDNISFDWDGVTTFGCVVDAGDYTVEVIARSNDGVAVETIPLTLTSSSSSSDCKEGGVKIKNIDLNPTASSSSNAWNPLEEDLEIAWELKDDFDSFKIEVDGIVVFEEDDLEEDEYDVEFDGKDDDGEYLESGTWELLFIGEIEDVTYYVVEEFVIKYEEPKIDDTFVTKSSIDPDLGQGVYFGFKLEDDAVVDVEILRGTKAKVDLLEDEELEGGKWHAVYWDGLEEDGGDFDYKDSFKFRVTAKSIGDEDTFDTATESIDLAEDTASSSKSNITVDMLTPPISEEGGEFTLTFNMEDDAELRVGIWEGTSTSGTPDVELLPYTLMEAGDYKFVWDGKDSKGKILDDSFFSYKVFSKLEGSSSTESESGTFLIDDDIGSIFGGSAEAASAKDDSTTVDVSDNPYLVKKGSDDEKVVATEDCGFSDVPSGNSNCTAIAWSKTAGVFEGDDFGNFNPYTAINRAEVLAVVLRAFDLTVLADDGTNLGWTDAVPGSWYMKYLRTGKLYGLLSGDGGKTTVRPGESVSRVEFLKFAYEAAQKVGYTTVPVCTVNPYSDVTVGAWYTNYVCKAQANNLFDVVSGLFLPGLSATRGEVAEALYRMLGQ